MRVGIDAHMIGAKETGYETYCRGLIEGLGELNDGNSYVAYLNPGNTAAELEKGNVTVRPLRRDSNVWRLTAGFAQASRVDRLDVLHVTYNVPFFTSCPLVVSVHDISYVHFPEFFSKRDLRLLNAYVPYSLKAARRVLTLSDSAADDIERVYRVPRAKIAVVPLAAREAFTQPANPSQIQEVCQRFGLDGPFLIAVGNLQPRKNLLRLVEAFAALPKSLGDLKLALVGKAQWQESEIYRRVEDLGLTERVVFTGYISDQELAMLYRSSLALVYPSLYEGFGLPILEAMACGTPVICSNTSSMPEVAGASAVLIDPLNVHEMAEAIVTVVVNAELRKQLSAKGLRRNILFSWRETARQTVRAYEECLAERSMPAVREAVR